MSLVSTSPLLECRNLSVAYEKHSTVSGVNLDLSAGEVLALIGPSGCGKSTLLRCFNRMNDSVPGFTMGGVVRLMGKDIYARGVDPAEVRRQVGMVFQKPNPFPFSIKKNITWSPRIHGFLTPDDELVERSLKQVALWEEVKDRLNSSGLSLSGGQQQRLCIARCLAMQPKALLMDEPCASLDPISTQAIEVLIQELKKDFAILIVTHNLQQARRIADRTAFMYQGELLEVGRTEQIFTDPKNPITRSYIGGDIG